MKRSSKFKVQSSKFTKLREGDEVKVVLRKDKGKTGKIEKVFPTDGKVLVSGVNQYKRHMKARSQSQPSEIATITKPLPVASVLLVCPKCHLTTRVGYAIEDNKKRRICKKCQQVL